MEKVYLCLAHMNGEEMKYIQEVFSCRKECSGRDFARRRDNA